MTATKKCLHPVIDPLTVSTCIGCGTDEDDLANAISSNGNLFKLSNFENQTPYGLSCMNQAVQTVLSF